MTTTKDDIKLERVLTNIGANADGLFMQSSQNITQEYLDGLKQQRDASGSVPEGEFMRVASIPTVIVDKWMREGFDILSDRNITAHDIIKRLKAEHLDGFLTTNKTV
jgi:hypothetical protein